MIKRIRLSGIRDWATAIIVLIAAATIAILFVDWIVGEINGDGPSITIPTTRLFAGVGQIAWQQLARGARENLTSRAPFSYFDQE
jgi:hypothetical protein